MEPTYWINREKQIVIVKLKPTQVQGWKATGRNLNADFDHGHFQITYSSEDILQESLKGFEPSTVDEYLEIQFAQHQMDDYFRKKANDFKQKKYDTTNG